MRFKKVYIEITNRCNLNCSFCKNNSRYKEDMSLNKFEIVLKKIKKYTDYIYLHVKGEPLLHSNLDGILNLCNRYNMKVNITTNGVLLLDKINVIKKYNNIRQINISLHSENNKSNYLDDILKAVELIPNIYISYRFWTNNDLLNKLKEYYNYNSSNGNKLSDKRFLSFDKEFIWPDINNDYYKEKGYCHGLKSHIGILVDGSIVICCLDTNGDTKIGNIFTDNIDDILNSDMVNKIIDGFNNRCVYFELCKHCSYKEKFDK